MHNLIASNNKTLIVGLGATGLSVARYLQQRNQPFCFADDRAADSRVAQVQEKFPDTFISRALPEAGEWDGISRVILSPGVPRRHPAIQSALDQGVEVIGDVELFAREVTAPVVAITGSNGKSTVTTLVGEMARNAGLQVAIGGNLGTPALDLIDATNEMYVLELSSFQLESTFSLCAQVATVLNVSQDHLDRYTGFQEYFVTKQRIYHRAKQLVINRDDPFTQPPLATSSKVIRFCAGVPDLKDFGFITEDGEIWLAHGLQKLLPLREMRMRGKHNAVNALAALALGHAVGLEMSAMLRAITTFSGLPHRCQLVATLNEVDYVNDSKATNVGATQAALRGLATEKTVVLLAGGEGKGADFSEMFDDVNKFVKKLIVFGKDASKIESACAGAAPCESTDSLQNAVRIAYSAAQPGDTVLLSPACASLDMFENYQARGQRFAESVEALCQP